MHDDDDQSERRISASDIREIARNQHGQDTRLAVLESRMDGQERRMTGIEAQIGETKKGVDELKDMLVKHATAETEQQNRILVWVIMTLLSVVGSVSLLLINHWWR